MLYLPRLVVLLTALCNVTIINASISN